MNSMNSWPEMPEYERRFQQAEARFIDQPREAVGDAESVVREAVDRMLQTMRGRLDEVKGGVGRGDDTERLRLAMKSYRQVMHDLGGTSDGAQGATATADPARTRTATAVRPSAETATTDRPGVGVRDAEDRPASAGSDQTRTEVDDTER